MMVVAEAGIEQAARACDGRRQRTRWASARRAQVDRLVDDFGAGRIGRRQFLGRSAALGLSLPAASALMAACGGATAGANGGNLHLAPGNVVTLDPAFVDGEIDIANAIFEGLVAFKQNTYDLGNVLAETIEQSPDGLSVHFTLKQGIQFHHGFGEVTAEDVKFSFERMAGLSTPKVETYFKDDWSALRSVEVKSKYEGVLHMKEPYGPLFRTTLPGTAGWVMSKRAYEEMGPKKIKLHPIGTGKYQFKEVLPQQRSVLERAPNYSGASDAVYGEGKAGFKELTFVYVPANQALEAAMQTGELEYIDASITEWNHLKGDGRFKSATHPLFDLGFIGMNTVNPVLRDINVRRAIRAAIDRKTIFEVLSFGIGRLTTGFVPPEMGIGYWKDAPDYAQDLDAAEGYMRAAGVSSMSVDFNYGPDPGSSKLAELIQGDLAKIGIKLVLKPDINFGTPGPSLKTNGLFVGFYSVPFPDPSWLYVWFTKSQIGQYNYMNWDDPTFNKLYHESTVETDPKQRDAVFIEMAKRIDEAAIVLPTAWGDAYGIYNADVVQPAWAPNGRPLYAAFKAV